MIVREQTVRFDGNRIPIPRGVRVGYESDHLAERLIFEVPQVDGEQSVFLMLSGKHADAAQLDKEEDGRYFVDLTADMLGEGGVSDCWVQVRGVGWGYRLGVCVQGLGFGVGVCGLGLGFGLVVWGSGLGSGLGFGVMDLGFGLRVSGFAVRGLRVGVWVWGLGLGLGVWVRVRGSRYGLGVWGSEFGDWVRGFEFG